MTQKSLKPAEINDLAVRLNKLAGNLWWTWDEEAQEIFHELSPRGWRNLFHNAVAVLHEVSDYELKVRLQNPDFAGRVGHVVDGFDQYMAAKDTWGAKHAPNLQKNPVAYFTAEFGFHETLPIAAGGLGILAGDHAKSASDLNIGFVGISLFYREGYFQQAIDHNNWQTEYYSLLNPDNLPMEPVHDADGNPIKCTIRIASSEVAFTAWRVNVGRNPIYLLDTNLPENEPHYRDLTLRVYGGDTSTRIMQEMLLGVGGVRLMRALGIAPSVFHMNEGHAAFLAFELIREKLESGKSLPDAETATREECIFTTHTPVEAGHDRFSADLMGYTAHCFSEQLQISQDQLMGYGRVNADDSKEPFCMTVLALKFSRAANAVSELHGRVSRHMWHCMYPDLPVEEVPIGHITNGIHLLGWMKGPVRKFWRRKFSEEVSRGKTASGGESTRFWKKDPGRDWAQRFIAPEFWQQIEDPSFVSDEELWSLRYTLRREMIEFCRRRLLLQQERVTQRDFIMFDHQLNPDALTVGFARRFATYKRAPLIFQRLEEIVHLCRDRSQPVQFIFAGKAHPRDDEGKRFIQKINHLSKYSDLKGHLVFIENYDIHVARQMVSGCDIWMNNPRRPLEASGTSGMKASCHGGMNMSILDGWWREGYDGANGFAVGDDSHPDSVEEQDRVDSENLYKTLTEQVVPMFFDRDDQGIPREWIKRIRHTMATLVPQFTTDRMVKEYTTTYYLPQGK